MKAEQINTVASDHDASAETEQRTPDPADFYREIFTDLNDDEVLWTTEFAEDPNRATGEHWGGAPHTLCGLPEIDNQNHFYAVATFAPDDSGVTKRDIAHAVAFNVLVIDDLNDYENPPSLPPTYTVDTSPNSRQLQYVLDVPADLTDPNTRTRVLKLEQAVSGAASADESGNNIVRYVRPPWGLNTKAAYRNAEGCPVVSLAQDSDPARRYTLEQLEGMVAKLQRKPNAPGVTTHPGDHRSRVEDANLKMQGWLEAIRTGESFHDPLIKIAASYLARGLDSASTVATLEGLMHGSAQAGTERWQSRFNEVSRYVDSATEKYAGRDPNEGEEAFQRLMNSPHVAEGENIDSVASPIPESLLTPPGRLSDLAAAIMDSTLKQQPDLSLAGALATVATLSMNKYTGGPHHTRLNVYLLQVAVTGSGKEATRDGPTKVFRALKQPLDPLRENLASGPALLRLLSVQPTVLFSMDEFGLKLERAYDKRGGGHERTVVDELITMYSKAGTTYLGKNFANSSNDIDPIHNPFVSLLGATGPRALMSALSSRQLADGVLSRFILFDTPSDPPKEDATPPRIILPKKLREALQAIGRPGNTPENPVNMVLTPEAWHVYKSAEVYEREMKVAAGDVGALYARVHENSMKLAAICALLMEHNTAALMNTSNIAVENLMEGITHEQRWLADPRWQRLPTIEGTTEQTHSVLFLELRLMHLRAGCPDGEADPTGAIKKHLAREEDLHEPEQAAAVSWLLDGGDDRAADLMHEVALTCNEMYARDLPKGVEPRGAGKGASPRLTAPVSVAGSAVEPVTPLELTIPVEAMQWGVNLAKHCVEGMARRARVDMHDTEIAGDLKKVLKVIAKAHMYKTKNPVEADMFKRGIMPKGSLTRRANMKRTELWHITKTLEDMGAVDSVEFTPETGRPSTHYKITQVGLDYIKGEG